MITRYKTYEIECFRDDGLLNISVVDINSKLEIIAYSTTDNTNVRSYIKIIKQEIDGYINENIRNNR